MRRALAIAAGILAVLLITFVARAQTAPSDYDFIIDITVENTSSTDYDGPIPVVMNTGNLSAGGFYNATGTDILFTDSSNDTIGGLPQGITSTTSTWWWGGSVPGETTRTFRVFMGGPAATTSFPFHAGNTIVTVPDDASIDYTTSTDIRFDAEWRQFPTTGDAFFVRKPFSYEVGLNQTTLFARAYSIATTTGTLLPESDITVNHDVGPAFCSLDPPSAACAALDDGELIATPISAQRTDHYNLEDSSGLSSDTVVEIFSVDLVFEHRCNGGSTCTSEGFVRLPGFESTTGAIAVSSSFVVRTTALPFAPDGSVWTAAALDDLTIGITSTATGGVLVETDYVWLSVQFLAGSEHTWTDTTLVANRQYHVRAVFGESGGVATWLLQIDDEPEDETGPFSQGPILANAIALSFGRDLDGRMSELELGVLASDTDVALDFTALVEGQVGTSTNGFVWTGSVQGSEPSTLDATYNINVDNTSLTTTVFALQVVAPTAPAAATIPTVDSVGDPSVAILFVTSTQSSDNPILGALFDACTAGGIPCDAWWLLLMTVLVGVAGSIALTKFDSVPTVAALSLAAFLMVSLFGGYSPWVVAMIGLWFLGMVPLLQFANKS